MRFLILMLCSLQLLSVNGQSFSLDESSFTVLPTTGTSTIKQFSSVQISKHYNLTSNNSSSFSKHGVISSSYTVRPSAQQYSPSPASQSKHIKLFANTSSTSFAKSVKGTTNQPTVRASPASQSKHIKLFANTSSTSFAKSMKGTTNQPTVRASPVSISINKSSTGQDGKRSMKKAFTLSSSSSYVPHINPSFVKTISSSVQLVTSSSIRKADMIRSTSSQSVIVSSSESVSVLSYAKQSKMLSSSYTVAPFTRAFITISAIPSTTQFMTSSTNQHINASTYRSSTPTTSQFSSSLNNQPTSPPTSHFISITSTSSNKGTLATSLYSSHTNSSTTSSSFVMHSSRNIPTKGPGSSKKSKKNKTTMIVGLSVGITLVIILFVVVVVCYRRKRASHQYNVFYDEQNIVMNPFDGPK